MIFCVKPTSEACVTSRLAQAKAAKKSRKRTILRIEMDIFRNKLASFSLVLLFFLVRFHVKFSFAMVLCYSMAQLSIGMYKCVGGYFFAATLLSWAIFPAFAYFFFHAFLSFSMLWSRLIDKLSN